MPKKGIAGLGVLAGLLLSLGGCSDSDEDKVKSVADLFAKIDPAVCEKMTKQALADAFGAKGLTGCSTIASEVGAPKRAAVETVEVDGDKATATVSRDGEREKIFLVKRDDEWKIAPQPAPTGLDKRPPIPKPKVQPGLSAEATVEAWVAAIDNREVGALCGLLSKRLAQDVFGAPTRSSARDKCVRGKIEWEELRKDASNLQRVRVGRSGNAAKVRLSKRAQAVLKKEDGRWVIDNITK